MPDKSKDREVAEKIVRDEFGALALRGNLIAAIESAITTAKQDIARKMIAAAQVEVQKVPSGIDLHDATWAFQAGVCNTMAACRAVAKDNGVEVK